jgi:hypothetical protein
MRLNLSLYDYNMILQYFAGIRKIPHDHKSGEHKECTQKKRSFAALGVGRFHGIKMTVKNRK